MIKQLKIGFKMLRHTHGIVSCTLGVMICFLFGVVIMVSPASSEILGNAVGAYFIGMVPIFIMQMFYSLQASSMIATSAYAKKMQTSIPSLVSGIGYIITYAIVAGIQMVKANITPENSGYIALETVLIAVLWLVFASYMGAALKYFVISTVLFFVFFCVISSVLNLGRFFGFALDIPVWTAGVLGFVIVIAGCFAQYGISLLLYKRPMSKYAQLSSLRKTM